MVDDGQDDATREAPHDVAGSTGASPLAGLRVLVVDDSPTVRRTTAACLEDAGAEVTLAEDGFSALASLVRTRPHALVADIVMPRLDGYQVCALVRGSAEFAALPVLLLTSRDGLFDRARGSVAGASGHLPKPVEAASLVARLRELVLPESRHDGAATAEAARVADPLGEPAP